MKTAAYNLFWKSLVLCAFAEKYRVGDRDCLLHISDSDKSPGVTFYSFDKEWVISTFGRDDWKTDARGNEGMQSVCKLIDGVKVRLFNAYACVMPTDGLPVNPSLFGLREATVTP